METSWFVVGLLLAGTAAALAVVLLLQRRRQRRREVTRRGSATVELLDTLVADSLGRIVRWIGQANPDLRPSLGRDGTVTLLFSDITGSTRLNLELGDEEFARLVRAHDAVVKRLVRHHRGTVVKTQGDGFMAAFTEPLDAVRCALALRHAFADGREVGRPLALRIGVHRGAAVSDRGDYFGATVAFAARVADTARGGEILATDAVVERLDADDAEVRRRGRRVRFRGLPGRHTLHRIGS